MGVHNGGVFNIPGAMVVSISFVMGALMFYSLQQQAWALGSSAGVAATGAARAKPDRFHKVPCPPPRQPGAERKHLVFAAVGDSWEPSQWSYSDAASWDLVAVYFGNRSDWDCPECTLALRMPGSFKWQMVWALMAETAPQWRGLWSNMRQQYDYVMVADDDLIMDACTIGILFQTMRQRSLLAAQPSNCRGNDSDNPYWVHWQMPGMELHYVNLVEVTAPAFEMAFLDKRVRPLLEHSYSGWGLPFCFSALTRFARVKLAAVDAACMIHPARADVGKKMLVSERIRRGLVKPGSIYARFSELTPYAAPLQEQRAVWQLCGCTNVTAWAMRQAYPPVPAVLGVELAEGSGVEWPPPGVTARGAAAKGAARQQQQQLAGVASAGRLLQAPLVLLAQLCLAAAVGAVGALQWDRRTRAKGPATPPRQQLPALLGSRSPYSSHGR